MAQEYKDTEEALTHTTALDTNDLESIVITFNSNIIIQTVDNMDNDQTNLILSKIKKQDFV